MTDPLAEFRAAESVRAAKRSHPEGWEPGVAWDGRKGTITSRPLAEPTPDWTSLLETWGFDPKLFEIIEPVQVRTWDAAIGDGNVRTMWYYKAGLQGKRSAGPDVAALTAEIRRHKPKAAKPATAESALVVCLSDWQIGKEGTTQTVERILAMIDSVSKRIRQLKPAKLYVFGLGDVSEGCDGFYAQQTFTVELNQRDQMTVARRLITKAITEWSPLVPEVIVAAVGGNHGEARRDGKSYTDFADNSDVAVFEQVAEVISASRYANVTFVLPREQLTLTLNVNGHVVGLAHGHQARRGATPQAKIANWVAGQAYGMRPVGDATLVFSGHFHHLSVIEDGPRTLFQAPTMDSGSQWWEETAGKLSKAGTLTVVINADGWSDLQIIR